MTTFEEIRKQLETAGFSFKTPIVRQERYQMVREALSNLDSIADKTPANLLYVRRLHELAEAYRSDSSDTRSRRISIDAVSSIMKSHDLSEADLQNQIDGNFDWHEFLNGTMDLPRGIALKLAERFNLKSYYFLR